MSGTNVTINQLTAATGVNLTDVVPIQTAAGTTTPNAQIQQLASTVFKATATTLTLVSGGNITSAGNFTLGGGTALATNATLGYVMMTSCAGAPSGVPVGFASGNMPIQYDTVNNKFWVYAASGAWRGVALI